MKTQIKKKDPSLEFMNKCFIRFQRDKMPATIEDDGVQILAEMNVAKTKTEALRKCFRKLRLHIDTLGVPCQIDGYSALSVEDFVHVYGLCFKAEVRLYIKSL